MIKNVMKFVAMVVLITLPLLTSADQLYSAASKNVALEVSFLSVDIASNGLGSVVARPCDDVDQCALIYARISESTKFTLNRNEITLREARRVNWAFGTIAVDDNGNAVKVSLIQAGPSA